MALCARRFKSPRASEPGGKNRAAWRDCASDAHHGRHGVGLYGAGPRGAGRADCAGWTGRARLVAHLCDTALGLSLDAGDGEHARQSSLAVRAPDDNWQAVGAQDVAAIEHGYVRDEPVLATNARPPASAMPIHAFDLPGSCNTRINIAAVSAGTDDSMPPSRVAAAHTPEQRE